MIILILQTANFIIVIFFYLSLCDNYSLLEVLRAEIKCDVDRASARVKIFNRGLIAAIKTLIVSTQYALIRIDCSRAQIGQEIVGWGDVFVGWGARGLDSDSVCKLREQIGRLEVPDFAKVERSCLIH